MPTTFLPHELKPNNGRNDLEVSGTPLSMADAIFPPLPGTSANRPTRRPQITVLEQTYSEVVANGISVSRQVGILRALPLEVRENVYEWLMRDGGHFEGRVEVSTWRYDEKNAERPHFLPAILWTSHQIWVEGTPIFIKNAAFNIRNLNANRLLTAFLQSLPKKKGFGSVRELHFPNFHFFRGRAIQGVSSDISLIVRCQNLKTLSLAFHLVKMTMFAPANNPHLRELRPVSDIIQFYFLERLLLCQTLKKIILDGIDNDRLIHDCGGTDPKQVLHSLANELVTEFREQANRTVEIVVNWR